MNRHRHLKTATLIGLLSVFSSMSQPEKQTFTIDLIVLFKETGPLYIMVDNESTSPKNDEGVRTLIHEFSDEELQSRRCSLSFPDMEAGVYGIKCYLDKNKNGKLDIGMFGPKEPWGMSIRDKRPIGPPKFEDYSFVLEGDSVITVSVK